jgi:hypothetical protein
MATARPNWHENAFFGIHYDQHAGAKDTVLGAELTHEHLRERLLRVINRGAGETLGPQCVIVEELPPVQNVLLRIRREGRPKSITLVPADAPLEWSYAHGQVVVKVPSVAIHSVVVVE